MDIELCTPLIIDRLNEQNWIWFLVFSSVRNVCGWAKRQSDSATKEEWKCVIACFAHTGTNNGLSLIARFAEINFHQIVIIMMRGYAIHLPKSSKTTSYSFRLFWIFIQFFSSSSSIVFYFFSFWCLTVCSFALVASFPSISIDRLITVCLEAPAK